MNLEKTLREIVETQMNLFGLNENRSSYKLHQVYSSNLIHAINGEILELPKGVERISICYRNSINNCLNDRDFIYYDNVLIPLSTHVYSEKYSHLVYFLDNEFNWKNSIKLSKFVVNRLSNKVVLTRVLSEEELFAWKNNGKLGSIHNLFWKKKTIHTTLDSVSEEFKPSENYSNIIKIHLNKEELQKLFSTNNAEIGTYSFLFPNRNLNSHFPFDMEISFLEKGFSVLIEGYNRWRKEYGVDSLEFK